MDIDGYGYFLNAKRACVQPAGSADNARDCKDAKTDISPGATEACDKLDNHCDGEIDEGLDQTR